MAVKYNSGQWPYSECKKLLLLKGYTIRWWTEQKFIIRAKLQMQQDTAEAIKAIKALPVLKPPFGETKTTFKRFMRSEGIRYIDISLAFGHSSVFFTERWTDSEENQGRVQRNLKKIIECKIINDNKEPEPTEPEQQSTQKKHKKWGSKFNPILHTGEDREYLI